MGALAASSLTYSIKSLSVSNFSVKTSIASITFGDGSSTYPSGGLPLTGGNLGLPNTISALEVVDAGTSGYMFNWDSTNNKIRLYFPTGSHGHSLFLKDAAQADGATTRVNAAASNKLGANTSANITVVASDGAANGGVVTNAGVIMSEVSTAEAPASLTILVRAIGY